VQGIEEEEEEETIKSYGRKQEEEEEERGQSKTVSEKSLVSIFRPGFGEAVPSMSDSSLCTSVCMRMCF
jgi:hypothetical protein